MKAVILSAGQGRRLLPLTEKLPKCALPVAGRPIILRQIDTLFAAGIEQVVVVLGHEVEAVEQMLARHPRHRQIRTLYNPFYAVSDNLASCWLAAPEMDADFMLLNGDTLCELAVVQRLLASPRAAVTSTVNRKSDYDDDDMRVTLKGKRLSQIGKRLPRAQTDGEAIGMTLFRGNGPARFRWALERAVRHPQSLQQWYVSVLDELARSGIVSTCLIDGLRWTEVDTPEDLELATRMYANSARAAEQG